jgi:hypothetical protein
MADRMRLKTVATTAESGSLKSVYNVFGKSEQKVFGNSEHMPRKSTPACRIPFFGTAACRQPLVAFTPV